MNNSEVIHNLATMPDIPLIVKDGDVLYQVQSVQQVQGFILVNLGGPVMRSSLNALSNSGEPVGMGDGSPDVPANLEEILAANQADPNVEAKVAELQNQLDDMTYRAESAEEELTNLKASDAQTANPTSDTGLDTNGLPTGSP